AQKRNRHSFPTRRSSDLKKVDIADALEHLANAQYEQGKYDLAIETCQKSLGLRDEAKEKVKIAAMLDRLGSLQYDQGNYAAALRSEEHTSELQSRGHLVC